MLFIAITIRMFHQASFVLVTHSIEQNIIISNFNINLGCVVYENTCFQRNVLVGFKRWPMYRTYKDVDNTHKHAGI